MTDLHPKDQQRRSPWSLIQDNSLSIALFGLFFVLIAVQSVVGLSAYNESLTSAHLPVIDYSAFLLTGTFQNAAFSNWQAAVLQLAVLISFSTVLRQRGAAHSRKGAGEKMEEHGDAKNQTNKDTQAADLKSSLKGNWLYNNSLSVVMFILFLFFFVLHTWSSNRGYNEEQAIRHVASQSLSKYITTSSFWFVTVQTWEAEFLAIGLYIIMSIFLRQERSPESKKAGASDGETGETND